MSFSVSYIYQVLDKYSGPLRKIDRSTKIHNQTLKNLERRLTGVNQKQKKVAKSSTDMQSALAGLGGAVAFQKLFQVSSRLEDSLGDVDRVMEFTKKNTIEAFRAELEKMSLQLGRSTSTLANMSYEAGKLGITGRKDILFFVGLSAKMSDAFDMAGEEASSSLGQIRDMLKLPLPQLKTLADSVNFLADSTSASGSQMINIIRRASGTFGLLEMKPQSVAGWAAFADIIEVSPELAASGLNRMFAQMVNIKGLGKQMMKAPDETVKSLLLSLKKMDKVARAAAAEKLFGAETARFVLKAVNNVEKLTETLRIASSSKAINSIQKEFDSLSKRASFKTREIAIAFENTMVILGDHVKNFVVSIAPALIKITKFVKKFSKAHPTLIKIGLAFFAILTAVSLILVPIAVLYAAITALIPVFIGLAAIVPIVAAAIGTLLMPIPLIVAGIAALVWWLRKPGNARVVWESIKISMLAVWGAMKKVWSITKKLFTLDFGGAWSESIQALLGFLGKLRRELESIKAFLDLLKGKKEKGELGKEGGELLYDRITNEIQSMKSFFRLRSSQKAAEEDLVSSRGATINNKMELGGQIRVEALPGTRVDRATINLNTGQNMAYA